MQQLLIFRTRNNAGAPREGRGVGTGRDVAALGGKRLRGQDMECWGAGVLVPPPAEAPSFS